MKHSKNKYHFKHYSHVLKKIQTCFMTFLKMSCCKCGFFFQWPAFLLLLVNIGDYFRADDSVDQSPGNLSSSSLRRKLFLDVNGSISDSLPSASPRSPPNSARGSLEVFSPMDLSPLHSSNPVQTPCAIRCGWLVCHRCASSEYSNHIRNVPLGITYPGNLLSLYVWSQQTPALYLEVDRWANYLKESQPGLLTELTRE